LITKFTGATIENNKRESIQGGKIYSLYARPTQSINASYLCQNLFQMYERKIPEDLDCGINITMKVLGAKWQACIIDAIDKGIKRPSELHRRINAASPRVINMQLRELESYGIISKKIYQELPLRVEYSLTELGNTILPVIDAIEKWGQQNREHVLRTSDRLKEENQNATAENVF
jgi:DNA-binding HxlR family transcriptional regulator